MSWHPRDCSATTFPAINTPTSIATLEQGESSKGRKRSYDSARYASLTPEQKKARRERDRIRRQSLTPEAREEINARRRSRMQSLTLEERQEKNARRRAQRQSLPPEQRQTLLNREKEYYTARRATPCAESIAMQCPELGVSPFINPLSSTPASAVVNGAREMLLEPSGSALNISSSSIPTSAVENDALGTLLDDVMDEDTIPEPSASLVANPSMSPFTIGTDDDLDNFLKDVMHEDRIPEEDMDEEYYLFAGEGMDNCEVLDPADLTDASVVGSNVLDPFEHVYSNIPDSTHMLKPVADCNHCGAKRFEYEPKSFCCRGGKIRLTLPEPPPELRRLWSRYSLCLVFALLIFQEV